MRILQETKVGAIVTTQELMQGTGDLRVSLVDGEICLWLKCANHDVWIVRLTGPESTALQAKLKVD